MPLSKPLCLVKVNTSLVDFTGATMVPEGPMHIRVEFGTPPCITSLMVNILIVKSSSAYNVILGRKTLYELGVTISIPCLKMKFPTPHGVGEECSNQQISQDFYVLYLKGKSVQVN
jgi:hypothetical protein